MMDDDEDDVATASKQKIARERIYARKKGDDGNLKPALTQGGSKILAIFIYTIVITDSTKRRRRRRKRGRIILTFCHSSHGYSH